VPTHETSISIAAPRERVWRVLSDVAAWPEWLPTVSSVQSLDGRALAIGHRYVVRQPKLQPVTWLIATLEPPRRFIWQGRTPGLLMIAEHIVDEESSGTSRVLLRFSFGGPLGGLIGALYGSITQRYITTEAATLKQKVEASR
jgi:uncharacterized membrane protein